MKLMLGAICVVLAACTATVPPKPFESGEQVAPPSGCVQGKERGVEC